MELAESAQGLSPRASPNRSPDAKRFSTVYELVDAISRKVTAREKMLESGRRMTGIVRPDMLFGSTTPSQESLTISPRKGSTYDFTISPIKIDTDEKSIRGPRRSTTTIEAMQVLPKLIAARNI